jgi:hypothetical protein
MGLLASFVVWAVYFGLTAGVIVLDGKMQRAKAQREGGVDFMDRSPWSYLVLALLCGPLPLIFYFGTTRKNAMGWLMGVGAAVGVYIATVVVSVVMQLAMGAGHVR